MCRRKYTHPAGHGWHSPTNKTGSFLPVSLILRKSTGDAYIVKDKRVGNGENEEVIKGNKIILLPGDQLISISVDANAFDAIASILAGVA